MADEHFPLPPSDLFGALFVAVQSSGIFSDSKTFADAVPLREPELIMADWAALTASDNDVLRNFVETNFDIADHKQIGCTAASSLRSYIADLWPSLTHLSAEPPAFSSSLPLPRPFVVPGGRFRELYYWDSYFTMLGLGLSGRQDLVEDMIVNLGALIDRYGHIPNGSRSYYLSRSHPPVFYLAAALSHERSPQKRRRRLDWMRREHRFWMDGEDQLGPGAAHRRVVRLPDGALLNRYWDDRATPRDESWTEDVELAESMPQIDSGLLWRNLRAAAESGWDFSSRWLADKENLGSIRTTRLLPIDLNCLLFGLELAIARECIALGDDTAGQQFTDRAERRASAVNNHLWNEADGFYGDFDLDAHCVSEQLTAAAAFPLFVGVCSPEQAERSGYALASLLQPWGLATTLLVTDQQWDAPNGWAPLQWIAYKGLKSYGQIELADKIAHRWNAVVEQQFVTNRSIFEKYDVVTGQAGQGGEYNVEIGFGWTNGVALALGAGDTR